MSLKKVHDDQPEDFKFSEANLKKAEEILKKYPKKNQKSALMPFLYLAQKQNKNWIPLAAMKYIANYLSIPYISVYEVSTFYTMYNLAPVGKHFVQVCTTTPCLLRGANKINGSRENQGLRTKLNANYYIISILSLLISYKISG